ncbi:DsbA family protein [Nigerium massiliense]|uniref:DsbA family protein n=1 Tax=Nigerium massiliense TaxID=1522317 RepID=UPI00058DC12C|nr:thioredoxin domain-containing protein [Nigerium massiliense]
MPSNAANKREQLRALQEAQDRQRRNRRLIGISAAVIALVLIVVFAWMAISSMNTRNQNAAAAVAPNATANRDGIIMYPGKAKANAPVVHVYLDYQCPICHVFETRLGPTLDEMGQAGEVQVINHTMTFMDGNLRNTASTRAAIAATCSDSQGVYPRFNSTVFSNQSAEEVPGSVGYTDDLLRQTIPTQLGITGQRLSDFQACYDTKAPQDFLDGVNRMAYDAQVTATPTIKVGDKVLSQLNPQSTTPEQFRQMVLQG